jgi:hypothetical protein
MTYAFRREAVSCTGRMTDIIAQEAVNGVNPHLLTGLLSFNCCATVNTAVHALEKELSTLFGSKAA